MHELSITQEILNITLEKAKEAQATKIKEINLVIGEMSGIVDDCIQFYFDFLSKDSIASGASLSFKRIPMQVRCRQCQFSFSPDDLQWVCPQCGVGKDQFEPYDD